MNEYQCIKRHASKIARYQNSGHDARSLIAPGPITSSIQTSSSCKVKGNKEKSKAIKNHLSEHRRNIMDMQNRISRRLNDELKFECRKMQKRASWKKKEFEHVKPKVFEDSDSSITTAAASTSIGSSVEEISDPSSLSSTNSASSSRHKYYGEVPEYILKRQIINGRKERQKECTQTKCTGHGNKHISSASNKIESSDLSSTIEQLRKEIRCLPFGLQSEGSIKKRTALEQQLKKLEKEKRMLGKKDYW